MHMSIPVTILYCEDLKILLSYSIYSNITVKIFFTPIDMIAEVATPHSLLDDVINNITFQQIIWCNYSNSHIS